MAVKKSQIYSQLWNTCNALRSGMDASQYKENLNKNNFILLNLKPVSLN